MAILLAAAGSAIAQTVIKGNITTATGKDIVNSAMEYIGTPYRYGTMSPTRGFDCSYSKNSTSHFRALRARSIQKKRQSTIAAT